MFLKIFLVAITVCSLLGCMGANRKENKRLAAVIALVLFTVAALTESSIKVQEAQAAAVQKSAEITGNGDAWGTITIKSGGETKEYYWKEKEKE